MTTEVGSRRGLCSRITQSFSRIKLPKFVIQQKNLIKKTNFHLPGKLDYEALEMKGQKCPLDVCSEKKKNTLTQCQLCNFTDINLKQSAREFS